MLKGPIRILCWVKPQQDHWHHQVRTQRFYWHHCVSKIGISIKLSGVVGTAESNLSSHWQSRVRRHRLVNWKIFIFYRKTIQTNQRKGWALLPKPCQVKVLKIGVIKTKNILLRSVIDPWVSFSFKSRWIRSYLGKCFRVGNGGPGENIWYLKKKSGVLNSRETVPAKWSTGALITGNLVYSRPPPPSWHDNF